VTGPLVQSKGDIQAILERLGIRHQLPFELIPGVLPVIMFERPSPSTDKLCWGVQTIAGVAAEYVSMQLFNPVGSKRLIHVDSVFINPLGATGFYVGQHDAAHTTLSTTIGFRDRRVQGAPIGQVRGQSGGAAVVTQRSQTSVAVAQDVVQHPFDCYIGPGEGVTLSNANANITVTAAWYWEELDLEERG
jgi:hypothetical protein